MKLKKILNIILIIALSSASAGFGSQSWMPDIRGHINRAWESSSIRSYVSPTFERFVATHYGKIIATLVALFGAKPLYNYVLRNYYQPEMVLEELFGTLDVEERGAKPSILNFIYFCENCLPSLVEYKSANDLISKLPDGDALLNKKRYAKLIVNLCQPERVNAVKSYCENPQNVKFESPIVEFYQRHGIADPESTQFKELSSSLAKCRNVCQQILRIKQ